MNKKKLPADSGAMTLGIISLSIVLIGFCCGLLAVAALVLSIIGLVKANKSIALYRENEELYLEQSYKNVNTGRILNIIAIPISGIVSLIMIGYYFLYGAAVLSFLTLFGSMASEMERQSTYPDYEYYEETTDSTDTWGDDDYIIEEEIDSINLDSIQE